VPPPSADELGETKTSPVLVVSGLLRSSVEAGFSRIGSGDADDSHTSDAELLQAALTDYAIGAVDETSDDAWRVFFQSAAERDRAAEALGAAFPALSFQPLNVPDEEWAARSQESLRSIRVGNIIVAPPWDVPTTIVIQPSTGFGTGHHASTRLCLAALQRLELAGRSVLDIGTGSGVLAIAASRLGAADVTGIDDDADAVHAAWENLALNPGAQVSLIEGDFRRSEISPADVILANLTGALLIDAAERLRRLVNANGRLILSGFMTHEESAVAAAYSAFSVEHRGVEDGWVGLTLN
jgi:ribosomal protein L11 methyltransferase